MLHGSVAASLVGGVLAYAETRGLSRRDLLAAGQLAARELENPDNRISLSAYRRVIAAATASSGDPAFALRWAAAVDMADVSIVGLIMRASATMGDAFVQLQRFNRLALEVDTPAAHDRFQLDIDEQGLWMVDTGPHVDGFPELAEMSLARLVCGPRRFLGKPHVLEACFSHSALCDAAAYRDVFQCPVRFDQPRTALRLAPDIAEWPVAQEPVYLLTAISRHAETLLSDLSSRSSLAARVEARLVETLPSGAASAGDVASSLGVSLRTLHRRLRTEETSFRTLLESLRERLALELLSRPGASVKATAYCLGYSDPAAFNRAFRRWRGISPRQFIVTAKDGQPLSV